MEIIKLSNNCNICLTDTFIEHIKAHPDVTLDNIKYALSDIDLKSLPTNNLGTKCINKNIFPYKGRSALVYDPMDLDATTFFSKRKGRNVPSRINKELQGEHTNLLTIILKENVDLDQYDLVTTYWSSQVNVGPEPISPSIDPNTPEGKVERKKALLMWCKYSLSVQEIELDEDPYQSTWNEIIEKYGNYYHFDNVY